jgi:hypothetical protein
VRLLFDNSVSFAEMFTMAKGTHIWQLSANGAKAVTQANQTEIFANGDSGLLGTDVALGGPRPVQASFF